MNNIILGDGITGYIIAACLNYNNETFTIYGNGKYKPPSILVLKCKDINDVREYFNIFEIPFTSKNIKKYTKVTKIGYTTDFKNIYDSPTDDMKRAYLKKQHRAITTSSMSDSLNNFISIDLKLVYKHLKNKYSDRVIKQNVDKNKFNNLKNTIVYNTIFPTECNNNQPHIEYIKLNENNMDDYDYIYDCNEISKIKRITATNTEYIVKPKEYDFELINYYNEPKIYSTTNAKNNFTWIDISRNATKTQLKQEDIINFVVKYE